MWKEGIRPILTFAAVILLILLLSILTEGTVEDVCETQNLDVSAAVLADEPADQEGLVARAIIMAGLCDP